MKRNSLGLCLVLTMLGMGCGDPVPLIADLGSTDGGRDLGAADGAVDLGEPVADLGDLCLIGRPCDATRGCGRVLVCEEELVYPGGGFYPPDSGRDIVYFQDGYCTNATIESAGSREGAAGACDPTPADDAPGMDGCPACAKCFSLGSAPPDYINIVQCGVRCAPTPASNPCRLGYTCDFASHACVSGCSLDEECQVYREDTNMNGTLEREGPDGGLSPDQLRFDVAGGAACARATTGRCTQRGTPGISAGAPCVLDSECEMDGLCLSGLWLPEWIGGYCTKFGCDVLGCAGIGKCLDVGDGVNICTSPCKIGDDPGDPVLGSAAGDDDCRTGYACFWDGLSGPTDAVNGGCLAGNYNAVTVPNIGASCVDPDGPAGPASADDECWSPYGLGRCVFADASASCSISACAMLPAGACGSGNSCVSLSAETSLCLRDCTTAADCNADGGPASYGCVDATGMGGVTKSCFPGCQVDADCDALYRCSGGSATAFGDCVRR